MIINMVGSGGTGAQSFSYKRYYDAKQTTSSSEKVINCEITFPDVGVYYVFAPFYVQVSSLSPNVSIVQQASAYSIDSGDIDIEFLVSGSASGYYGPFFLMRVKQSNSVFSFKSGPVRQQTPRYLYMDVSILRVDGGGANNAVAALTYAAS